MDRTQELPAAEQPEAPQELPSAHHSQRQQQFQQPFHHHHQQQQQQQQQYPPQWQQYQQYPQTGSPNDPPHVSPKGMWVSKLVLRILSAILAIVVIGLTASGISVNEYYDYYFTAWPIVLFAPPCAIAFVWSVAEAISILARKGRRGIHPGACVAIDLLLWLGLTASIILFGLLGYTNTRHYYSYYYDDDDDYYDSWNGAVAQHRAALALAVILLLIHFVLFVLACCETSIRNRTGPVVVFTAPPPMMQYPGGYPGGHQSMMPTNYQAPYQPQGGYQHMSYAPSEQTSTHPREPPVAHSSPSPVSPTPQS